MLSQTWAVKTERLSKSFGHVTALRNINLEVAYQTFVSIIGPNGAGKSTLIRILCTLTRPSSGQVWVDGFNLREQGVEIRRRVGFVAHQSLLYGNLSAVENLRFYGRMYGVPHLEERIHKLLAKMELTERQNDAVRNFSQGMLQRLSIARAILHDPCITLLDEPYTGLDQRATERLRNLLRELLAEGHTILMTTHDPTQALELSNQVFILMAGQIVYQAHTATLSEQEFYRAYRYYLEAHQ